jgi:hypothetical protein
MINSPHIRELRAIAGNLLAIPANEQCIGHLQVALKDALVEIAEELERINKILGIAK